MRCTSRLALLHGVASDAYHMMMLCDPGLIYTTVDVAAVQLNIYQWTHGTQAPGSVVAALQSELKSPVTVSVSWETDKPTTRNGR